jgi:prepilin-type N-terminal cleavage/methylation domain-containing protein
MAHESKCYTKICKRHAGNSNGMSLVELMVSVGILAIVMAGMSSYINSVHTETRSLTEMMAKLEVEKNVIGVFADDVVCTADECKHYQSY